MFREFFVVTPIDHLLIHMDLVTTKSFLHLHPQLVQHADSDRLLVLWFGGEVGGTSVVVGDGVDEVVVGDAVEDSDGDTVNDWLQG